MHHCTLAELSQKSQDTEFLGMPWWALSATTSETLRVPPHYMRPLTVIDEFLLMQKAYQGSGLLDDGMLGQTLKGEGHEEMALEASAVP